MLDVSNYYVVDFDGDDYARLAKKEKEIYILQGAIAALKRIAESNGKNAMVAFLSEMERKIIDSNFELKVHVKKLDKIYNKNNIKYKVERVINQEVGEGWQCIVNKNGDVRKLWMHKIPHFLDMTDTFKKSDCSNQKYSIYDRLGNERFAITHLPAGNIVEHHDANVDGH